MVYNSCMIFTDIIVTVVFALLIVLILILTYFTYYLNEKINRFLIGSSSNIDESIDSIKLALQEDKKFRDDMQTYLLTVEKRLKKSVQAVNTVRFNPFKGTGSGSNQSFSTAFLNEERSGVVISSLYSREHISVYSKPVSAGKSEFELSEEEKESISNAMRMLKE